MGAVFSADLDGVFTVGPLTNQTFQGAVTWEDTNLTGVGREEIGPFGTPDVPEGLLAASLTIEGTTFLASQDDEWPRTPFLFFQDGEFVGFNWRVSGTPGLSVSDLNVLYEPAGEEASVGLITVGEPQPQEPDTVVLELPPLGDYPDGIVIPFDDFNGMTPAQLGTEFNFVFADNKSVQTLNSELWDSQLLLEFDQSSQLVFIDATAVLTDERHLPLSFPLLDPAFAVVEFSDVLVNAFGWEGEVVFHDLHYSLDAPLPQELGQVESAVFFLCPSCVNPDLSEQVFRVGQIPEPTTATSFVLPWLALVIRPTRGRRSN